MSVKLYDDAIIKNFRNVFDDSRIHILPVEQALRFTAQLERDNIQFPLISTTRLGYNIQTDVVNSNALRVGGFQRRTDDGTNVFAQTIPIRINYQLDIFTVDKHSGDEIVRELVFDIMQNPTLQVEIPYDLNTVHNFNIFLDSDVVDNSDTVEHVNRGVLFRNTLTFYTDDAYLWSSKHTLHGNVSADVKTFPKRNEGTI